VPAPSSSVSPVYLDSWAAPTRQIKGSRTVAIKFPVSAREAAELFTSRRALLLQQSQHSAELVVPVERIELPTFVLIRRRKCQGKRPQRGGTEVKHAWPIRNVIGWCATPTRLCFGRVGRRRRLPICHSRGAAERDLVRLFASFSELRIELTIPMYPKCSQCLCGDGEADMNE
jgi:hypothetical protein